jgi:Fic family protein
VAEQAQDAIFRAKRLQDLQATWRQRLTRPRGSALPLRLAESLFASPVLTIPQAQRLLDVTYHSARNTVRSLVSAGILQQVGRSSYGKIYVAAEILEVLGESQ